MTNTPIFSIHQLTLNQENQFVYQNSGLPAGEIAKKYSDGDISRLDGVTIEYEDYRFNVRPSNTEPLLRLNLEATSSAVMEEKRDEVLAIIRS